MKMLSAVPALPVADIARCMLLNRDKLGLSLVHYDETGFAIFRRDAIEIHLWAAMDQAWKSRKGPASLVVSRAESFIAGTVVAESPSRGSTTFAASFTRTPRSAIPTLVPANGLLDPDDNLITFFERRMRQVKS